MTPQSLTEFLHSNIPLTAAMQVQVRHCAEQRVELVAPLAPNRNHHGTAFGGSLAIMGILSGWTLLHHALLLRGIEAKLVIQKNECEFLEPVAAQISAACALPDAAAWASFFDNLARKKRARITLTSEIRADGLAAVKSHGTFVAVTGR